MEDIAQYYYGLFDQPSLLSQEDSVDLAYAFFYQEAGVQLHVEITVDATSLVDLFSGNGFLIDETILDTLLKVEVQKEGRSFRAEMKLSNMELANVMTSISKTEAFDLPPEPSSLSMPIVVLDGYYVLIERRTGNDVKRVVRMKAASVPVDCVLSYISTFLEEKVKELTAEERNALLMLILKEQ